MISAIVICKTLKEIQIMYVISKSARIHPFHLYKCGPVEECLSSEDSCKCQRDGITTARVGVYTMQGSSHLQAFQVALATCPVVVTGPRQSMMMPVKTQAVEANRREFLQ